tara:strand:- start:450 stop:791 length:342 start_codon:yes stop_codon:yes gene_type:complete
MIIFDHFGSTSLLECLQLDIPFVIIASKKLFKFRVGALSYYKLLDDAGVLIDPDLEQMEFNNKFNEIYSNIDYWWNLDKTKRAVSIFRENFAMTKKNGLTKYWIPEFKNHLSN